MQEINIEKFKEKKVVVLGEGMLDMYLYGTSNRLCREAPAPIITITSEISSPGGAANTAVNLAALGAKVHFVSIIGKDKYGNILKEKLEKFGVNTSNLFQVDNRETIVKNRILAESQLVTRVDTGTLINIPNVYQDYIISALNKLYKECDCLVISDYSYGVVTKKVLNNIKANQWTKNKQLIIDAKNLGKYFSLPITAVKPNYEEVCRLLEIQQSTNEKIRIKQILDNKNTLFSLLQADYIAITLDKFGSLLLEKNNKFYRTFSNPVENVKAVGAGDTYVAGFTLALLSNKNLFEAGYLATKASSLVIKREGTSYCNLEDLQSYIYMQNKYISNTQKLITLTKNLKENKKKIVFTNGCFDILHRGHIEYLQQAKKLGDILIVAINSDKSIKAIKGKGRPVNTLSDRIKILSALSFVDYVIPFNGKTPKNILKMIAPYFFVKGGDYSNKNIPEKELAIKLGCKIIFLPFIKNYSTTNIINKIYAISQSNQFH